MAAEPGDDGTQGMVVAIRPAQQDNWDPFVAPAPSAPQQQPAVRPVAQPGRHRIGPPCTLTVVHAHVLETLVVCVLYMFLYQMYAMGDQTWQSQIGSYRQTRHRPCTMRAVSPLGCSRDAIRAFPETSSLAPTARRPKAASFSEPCWLPTRWRRFARNCRVASAQPEATFQARRHAPQEPQTSVAPVP